MTKGAKKSVKRGADAVLSIGKRKALYGVFHEAQGRNPPGHCTQVFISEVAPLRRPGSETAKQDCQEEAQFVCKAVL